MGAEVEGDGVEDELKVGTAIRNLLSSVRGGRLDFLIIHCVTSI